MDFSSALTEIKANKKVARSGWNGKDMFIFLIPGSTFEVAEGRPLAAHILVGTQVDYRAHIDMRTADGSIVPWLASQTDLLADDWEIV
jgi:hypothetical protein